MNHSPSDPSQMMDGGLRAPLPPRVGAALAGARHAPLPFAASRPGRRSFRGPGGFTLIELLVVIAIIGILAAILIPTVGGVRNSAKRAETKVRFGQWATAMEQFKQEYGYYPKIDNGTGKVSPQYFAGALTGHRLDGTDFITTTDAWLCGNAKRISFYSVSENELSDNRAAFVDAFGNTDIVVLYDHNGDGMIDSRDGNALSVTGAGGGQSYAPTGDDLNLTTGIRAGVIFYSAGKGTNASDIVYSWK